MISSQSRERFHPNFYSVAINSLANIFITDNSPTLAFFTRQIRESRAFIRREMNCNPAFQTLGWSSSIKTFHTVLLTSFFRTSQYHKNISTLGQKSRCISLTIQDTAKLRVFLKSPQNFASDKPLTNKYEHSSLAGYLVLDAKIDESGAQPQVQEGNLSML